MRRSTSRRVLASAGMALAALTATAPRTLWAQGAAAVSAKDTVHAADTTTSRALVTTSVPRYLVDHGRALHLTAKQSDRIREVAKWLDSANAPLRAQWQQVTGGRPLRSMRAPERRRLGPQLLPVQQGIRANNHAALDSVDAILNPAQQTQLQSLLVEYRQRVQERQAHPAPAPPAQP